MPKKDKPKKKCCESSTRCRRCPLRMLKEGRLPEGYTVHRRRLVKLSPGESPGTKTKPDAAVGSTKKRPKKSTK